MATTRVKQRRRRLELEVVQVRHAPEGEGLRKVWVVNVDEVEALAGDLAELVDSLEYRR